MLPKRGFEKIHLETQLENSLKILPTVSKTCLFNTSGLVSPPTWNTAHVKQDKSVQTAWNELKLLNGGCGMCPKGVEENALLLGESYSFYTEWVLPLAIS